MRPHRRAIALLAALATACASTGSGWSATLPPRGSGIGTAAWPDDWGIQFALRCSAEGEDLRFCVCLANEIQRSWTPTQFQAREPDGLAGEIARCRERTSP